MNVESASKLQSGVSCILKFGIFWFLQKALAEFEETELQLHQMEVQGHKVLEKTSAEGQVHIVRDLERLRESWTALRNTSPSLGRCQKSNQSVFVDESSTIGDLSNMLTLGALV